MSSLIADAPLCATSEKRSDSPSRISAASRLSFLLGAGPIPRTRPSANSAKPDSRPTIRSSQNFWISTWASAICRATMPGRVVIQWDKEDCADLGIIKVDLLGLGMLAVLEDSIRLIGESYHEKVDLAHLPQNDPKVYSSLQKADTIGLFQVESRAQMSCLPRMRPERFYDIVVQVAIIRPGPIVGKMLNPYLRRRQGREKPECLHPLLEPILARTLGVPLFQEQLLRMAMVVANFTGGEAEELRRAMGFKRSQARMQEIETRLRSGMTANGIAPKTQEVIIQSITSFALYGFPESHAASFALIAYASAYLKCHYLAAFTAALLNNQPMGFYSPATIVKDAQRHGLKVLPIDVMKSEWNCTLEEASSFECPVSGENQKQIPRCARNDNLVSNVANSKPETRNLKPILRLGLRYARGLHEEAGQALVRQRMLAPFISIRDLVHRVRELRKDELNTLAAIGALNSVSSFEFPVSSEQQIPRSARNDKIVDNDHDHSPSGNTKPETGNLKLHRRDALWQVERAVHRSGPLLDPLPEPDTKSPLHPMNAEE